MEKENHAVFLERSSQAVRGTSSNQEVMFSATRVSGKISISYILHGKEFRFVYKSISFKKKKLNSIQLIPDSIEQNKKTTDDENILTLLYKELEQDINQLYTLEGGILSSLDLLINMVPMDEPFDKIDLHGARKKGLIQPQAITGICGQLGKVRTGTFDGDDGTVYTHQRTVGDPADECFGRCGAVCIQAAQIKKRQYTHECFVHDLCAEFFGQNLGNCLNEFTAAADGYINAPNCAFRVIGKWELAFDWYCNGVDAVVTLTLYSNHRFGSSKGYEGMWELNGNKIIRTYDGGTKYTGTIAATNMKTKGTMIGVKGETGCFTDTYLTTSIK